MPPFRCLQKVLPVLDNFEMALAAAQNAKGDKLAAMQSGVLMIQQQLKSALAETGLEEIVAVGQPFDPNFHEAVSEQESAEVAEGNSSSSCAKATSSRTACCVPPR